MTRHVLAILVGIALSAGSAVSTRAGLVTHQQRGAGAEASTMPQDATAKCADGSWSSADTRRGACSSHGGVKQWFGKPPKGTTARCKDGTYSHATDPQGTCSQHGGVAFRVKDIKVKA